MQHPTNPTGSQSTEIADNDIRPSRGFGWRINCSVEATELSTNEQHTHGGQSFLLNNARFGARTDFLPPSLSSTAQR